MALLSVISTLAFPRAFIDVGDFAQNRPVPQHPPQHLRSDEMKPRLKVPERPGKLDPFADRFSSG